MNAPFFCCLGWLTAFLLAGAPANAQGRNIAGDYRGRMTVCLSHARLADCRKGFTELIRLADDVDAKRAKWERANAAGDASVAEMQGDYALALTRLDRAVADFNRDMSSSPDQAK